MLSYSFLESGKCLQGRVEYPHYYSFTSTARLHLRSEDSIDDFLAGKTERVVYNEGSHFFIEGNVAEEEAKLVLEIGDYCPFLSFGLFMSSLEESEVLSQLLLGTP